MKVDISYFFLQFVAITLQFFDVEKIILTAQGGGGMGLEHNSQLLESQAY